MLARFEFGDFVAAALNHHPDWRNIYGRVEVALSTHEVGGITALDVALARRMTALAARLGAH